MSFFLKAAGGGAAPIVWDNALNTNVNDQQAWLIVGDSIARGTAHQFASVSPDKGPEADYAGSVYYYSGAVTEMPLTDIPGVIYGSMWPSFGNILYKRTSKKPVFINQGTGGCEFYPNGDNNNWSTSGTLYAPAVTAANNCLAALGTTRLRGIMLCCGINDARAAQTLANIQAAINSLITRLQTDFPGTPIYIINIGREATGTFDARIAAVRGYLEDCTVNFQKVYMAARLENFLSYYDDISPDLLHLTQEGNEEVAHYMGSNLLTNGWIANNPLVRSYTTEAQNVFARMPGVLSDTEKNLINDFVNYLERKGWLSQVKVFQFWHMDNQAKSLQDWFRTGKSGTLGSGATWNANDGITLDGTVNGYVRTNFLPLTDNGGLSNGNTHYIVWLRQAVSLGVDACLMGATGPTATHSVVLRQKADNSLEFSCHTGVLSPSATGPLKANTGHGPCKDAVSTQKLLTTPFVARTTGTLANTVAYPPNEMYVGAHNNNGVIQQPYQGKVSCFVFCQATIAGVFTLPDQLYKKIRAMILTRKYNIV